MTLFSIACSYIVEAIEMAFLSMLETIFYKILQRQESKQIEGMTWTGRICPKIKKKLEKFFEWSNNCIVKPAGNYLFVVESHEFEKDYSVHLKSRTCDCKRWQAFHATMPLLVAGKITSTMRIWSTTATL
jgi:hypothetical protein